MQTLKELEVWLEENGYNLNCITIGKHKASGPECDIFKFCHGNYVHCYSERGYERTIEAFQTEQELVAYARQSLEENKWARAHIIAFVFDEAYIKEVEGLLEKRKVSYERNDMPNYRAGEPAYRIFVFGKDIEKCRDIEESYMYRG